VLDKLKLPHIVVPDLTDFKVSGACALASVHTAHAVEMLVSALGASFLAVICMACIRVAPAFGRGLHPPPQLKPYVAYSPPPKK
jgi:hypothetical protein